MKLPENFGANNKVFTRERYEAALRDLKAQGLLQSRDAPHKAERKPFKWKHWHGTVFGLLLNVGLYFMLRIILKILAQPLMARALAAVAFVLLAWLIWRLRTKENR